MHAAADWAAYVAGYHDANPGITEDVLADARDNRARTPYDWLVEAVPAGAATVVDLACGPGDLCRELTRSGLTPIGADLSFGMLANARTAAPLIHTDALRLPFPEAALDGATCGFALRNFV
ncbi:MAG: methyltransferase domain-containing protein, partial [Actinomycetota bacterium]|nr:methyltransferase domain-containing protein [Actinomycetota bacterium]